MEEQCLPNTLYVVEAFPKEAKVHGGSLSFLPGRVNEGKVHNGRAFQSPRSSEIFGVDRTGSCPSDFLEELACSYASNSSPSSPAGVKFMKVRPTDSCQDLVQLHRAGSLLELAEYQVMKRTCTVPGELHQVLTVDGLSDSLDSSSSAEYMGEYNSVKCYISTL